MKRSFGKIGVSVIAVILISVLFGTTVFAQDYLYDGKNYSIAVKQGWNKLVTSYGDTYWYYGDSSGEMVTGWKKIDGKWYAFMGMAREPRGKQLRPVGMTGAIPETNGSMIKGTALALFDPSTQSESDAEFYSFEDSGAMATGWKYSSYKKAWLYHDPDSGKAVSGWRKIGSAWYYFTPKYYDDSGFGSLKGCEMKNGWLYYSGGWYYLNTDGSMVTGWVKVGGNWYYMNTSGVMQTGWVKIGGNWYCFDGNGVMITGWYRDGSTWYYFRPDGSMVTGWLKIGGVWYFFKPGGGMACNEWYGGYWFGNDGAWTYQPHGGWVKDDRGWRFTDDSGWCATDETIIIDGVPYTFDPDGYLIEDDISDWVRITQIPAGVEIVDTKWEYTYTQYKTSTSSVMDGWELYQTEKVWGDWGSWSDWSTTSAVASDSRDVETSTREICTLEGFCCGDSGGNRCYLAYMQDGYTLRLGYGQRTVSRDELNTWQAIEQGGIYDYDANVRGRIVEPGTAYIHPTEMVPFFVSGTTTETLYRYRDRSVTSYIYKFRKSERRTSYTDPTGQSGVSNVVKYVRYRIK